MTRLIRIIADDYGLAPGVSEAILDLLHRERLTGTSCMTCFPEWEAEAARLRPLAGRAALGLHLTLTDQPAATGHSSLAPQGRLPPLAGLALPHRRRRIAEADVHGELDAQHERFVAALGRAPDFVDGHQHVHFLPVVRRWLVRRFGDMARKPPLRGAPSGRHGLGSPALKVAAVAALATRFDRVMRRAGFPVLSPLAGIYDWRRPERFAATMHAAVFHLPEHGLVMCHPGHVDAVLAGRDPMQKVREAEHAFLASEAFGAMLVSAGAAVRTGPA